MEIHRKSGKTLAVICVETDDYFRRFAFCDRLVEVPPHADLGMVVAIPCFNEPDLVGSLESLRACDRPDCAVEVLVVVNSPAGGDDSIRAQNERTLKEASNWVAQRADAQFVVHLVHCPELPPKQAGVGLARKIAMDEAFRRLGDVGRPEGVVAGFDADCRCAPNYLRSLESHFARHARTPGCSIYFEHPLTGPLEPALYESIAAYELHLRYYVQALRHAGHPHAHHTLGSCMAVRAGVYAREGGMNKRQAGEDFYFLQKLFPLGGFTDLTETAVFPSPRASDRVPFGTGRAIRECLGGAPMRTYPLEAFLELKVLFERVAELRHADGGSGAAGWRELPELLAAFLGSQGFAEVLDEIRRNTSSEAAFRKRFFRWFNGFRVMKFVHYARDQRYGARAVEGEANRLLELLPRRVAPGVSIRALLETYRKLDRDGPVKLL